MIKRQPCVFLAPLPPKNKLNLQQPKNHLVDMNAQQGCPAGMGGILSLFEMRRIQKRCVSRTGHVKRDPRDMYWKPQRTTYKSFWWFIKRRKIIDLAGLSRYRGTLILSQIAECRRGWYNVWGKLTAARYLNLKVLLWYSRGSILLCRGQWV